MFNLLISIHCEHVACIVNVLNTSSSFIFNVIAGSVVEVGLTRDLQTSLGLED